MKHELYKWKHAKKYEGMPDVMAQDFRGEFKSVDYDNLVDRPRSYAVAKGMAEKYPEELSSAFKILFEEDRGLQERLTQFSSASHNIFSKVSDLHHHQDERTMATYLAYYDSSKYAFFKDSFQSIIFKSKKSTIFLLFNITCFGLLAS